MSAPADEFEPISTVSDLAPEGGRSPVTRGLLHAVTTAVLTIIIGLAVLDGLDVADVYGVDTATAEASGGGYDLAVRYGTVSRPALATPFEIVVTHDGGFDGPITIAVDRAYLAMWDENGLVPAALGGDVRRRVGGMGVRRPERRHARHLLRRPHRAGGAVGAGRPRRCPRGRRAVAEVRFETRVLP